MVRPIILVLGAIPAILAVMIAIPLLTQPEVPFSAANTGDIIKFEYTKHHLNKVSLGVTERVTAQKTEILIIENDGQIRYSVTEDGQPKPKVVSSIDQERLDKLRALVKETGFMTIPPESFPISDDIIEYRKSNVKITLNGITNQIHWPEQNATAKFIPPIITMVETQLDQIVNRVRE